MTASTPPLDLHAYVAALSSHPRGATHGTGAALRTAQGRMLVGCGVQAAGARAGCAIRHAIAAALVEEGSDLVIEALVMVAIDAEGESVAAVPCDDCIQWLMEFAPDAPVTYRHPLDGWCERKARALETSREAMA